MAIVDDFLGEVLGFIRTRDVENLRLRLRVEPPLPDIYTQLAKELKARYNNDELLEKHVTKLLPESDTTNPNEGDVWPGFQGFTKEYLIFWRDMDVEDLLEIHGQLTTLVNSCITALSNSAYGILVLPTAIQQSAALAKLAMHLDGKPELTAKLRKTVDQGESAKTLVEGTAETIQRAFTVCLSERTTSRNGVGSDGKPENKKIGIYSFANLVLKLLFKCRKTRLANQLFTNISQHSPQLSLYSANQRITYLYYLGRFLFSNGHFFRAQLCLQSAYDQCHRGCIKQRRAIIIYLIACNIILGRFPSVALLSRPECAGLHEKFIPICLAIRKGSLPDFKSSLGPESGNEQWFFAKGILLPLLYRTEVLVWRSLARKVFLLTYQFPNDPSSRKAPTLDLAHLVAAAKFSQRLLEGWHNPTKNGIPTQPGRTHTNTLFLAPAPLQPPSQTKHLPPHLGIIYGNQTPTLLEIEAIVASLVQQDLLHGFISHNQSKFAILGAKQRGGPLKAGFSQVWETMRRRAEEEDRADDVPGWVRRERLAMLGGVVNLTGIARPVGSGN